MRLRLDPHAAHYEGGGGHDLEWITIEPTVVEYSRRGLPCLPTNVQLPHGFEFHSGSVTKAGVQQWHFCRRAPLSQGRCGRCP